MDIPALFIILGEQESFFSLNKMVAAGFFVDVLD
jgi:hypothetical protein